MSETLFFSSSTVKRNYKPIDRANGQAKKCCHKRRYFGESLLRRIHGGQPTSFMFLLTFYIIIFQNVAICPKTFCNSIDR